MPFDGNGNWTSNFNAVADRDANIKIEASRFDNILLSDIASSFEMCLTKDTQVKPTQNFNANNYRIINVANPSNGNDAVNLQTMTSAISTSDSTAVHKSGTETIIGSKTFISAVNVSWNITQGTAPNSNSYKTALDIKDSDGNSVSRFQPAYFTDGTMRSAIQVIKPVSGSTATANLGVFYPVSGDPWAEAPTPSDAKENNTNKIVTTSWIKNSVDGGYICGIPDYANRTQFTTSTYTPAKNGIIRVMAEGGNAMAAIKIGNFVIARADCRDNGSGTQAVWAIVKKGETYTVEYNGAANHAFYFVPFS